MSVLKTVYKQTFIYGLATVVPKMLSFLLVRLHTDKSVLKNISDYGEVSIVFVYFVLFNVILAYGMETAFFRFFNKEPSKDKVLSTVTISILGSSLGFLGLGLLFQQQIADLTHIHVNYITLVVWTLFLDALVIIPFAYLRAQGKPVKYTAVKLTNVVVNLGLNVFLLVYLKALSVDNSLWDSIYIANFEVSYIFIANLVASGVTLLLLLPFYFKINYKIDTVLWKKMLRYALPVLVAGVAFSINETFDRVLLERLLPVAIAKTSVGNVFRLLQTCPLYDVVCNGLPFGNRAFLFQSIQNQRCYQKLRNNLGIFRDLWGAYSARRCGVCRCFKNHSHSKSSVLGSYESGTNFIIGLSFSWHISQFICVV